MVDAKARRKAHSSCATTGSPIFGCPVALPLVARGVLRQGTGQPEVGDFSWRTHMTQNKRIALIGLLFLSLLLFACVDDRLVIGEVDPTPTLDVRWEGTKTIDLYADRHKCQQDNPFSECHEDK